jgi:hypothetical protein
MTEQTYAVSVSGRTYFNVVLPAMSSTLEDLPSPIIMRAGRGAQARFGELTEQQAFQLGEFCKMAGHSWAVEGAPSEGGYSAASSILAQVFIKDGTKVHDQIEQQRKGLS